MGTLAKRLGQWAAKSLESEGSNIFKSSSANKVPNSLAFALDSTLRRGHDMKTFGLGTAASMSNVHRYGRFTRSMHAIYATMEQELDQTVRESRSTSPVSLVWERHGTFLRRANNLCLDLQDVGMEPLSLNLCDGDIGPTSSYMRTIRCAGIADRSEERSSARLLGHLYVRYLADLFGGQMLGAPTAAALSLPVGTPRHYVFNLEGTSRHQAIEDLYSTLNEAGNMVSDGACDDIVAEAMRAFDANVRVYAEEPMWVDAMKGVFNAATGLAKIRVLGIHRN